MTQIDMALAAMSAGFLLYMAIKSYYQDVWMQDEEGQEVRGLSSGGDHNQPESTPSGSQVRDTPPPTAQG